MIYNNTHSIKITKPQVQGINLKICFAWKHKTNLCYEMDDKKCATYQPNVVLQQKCNLFNKLHS